MDQPNKDKKKKKQANGDPIGATQQPVIRAEEQERIDAKAAALARTQEGKEHMAKVGQDVDIKTGRSTAKPFGGKLIKGDITIGTRDKYIKPDKTVIEDTAKNPGNAQKHHDRDKSRTDTSRQVGQDVHRTQVSGENNAAAERKRKADQDLANSKESELAKNNNKGNPLAAKNYKRAKR